MILKKAIGSWPDKGCCSGWTATNDRSDCALRSGQTEKQTVYARSNRTIRIPNVTATFDTLSYTQTVKGVISGEGATNTLAKLGTGMLVLDPGAAAGFSVASLITQQGTVHVLSGSNLVTIASGSANVSGFFMNGGTVLVSGGYLLTTGGGYVSIRNGTLIVTNGTVNLSSVDELLNAHGGTGNTTVSGCGVLDVKVLRISQQAAPAAGNVVNVNTGGTLRLNNFNIDTSKSMKGLLNLNGGTLIAKTATADFLGNGDGKWLTNIFVNVLSGGAVIDNNGLLTVTLGVAPGSTNAIGTLTLATTPAALGGVFLADVATNGLCDRLHVQGDLNLAGLVLAVADAGTLNKNQRYVIATYTGTLTGPFASAPLPLRWNVKYDTAAARST